MARSCKDKDYKGFLKRENIGWAAMGCFASQAEAAEKIEKLCSVSGVYKVKIVKKSTNKVVNEFWIEVVNDGKRKQKTRHGILWRSDSE